MRFPFIISAACGLIFGADTVLSQSIPTSNYTHRGVEMERHTMSQVSSSQDAALDRWIAGFKTRARREGISQTTLDRAFRGVTYDADVIADDINDAIGIRVTGRTGETLRWSAIVKVTEVTHQ